MKAIDAIKDRLLDIELPTAPPAPIDYTSNIIIIISVLVIIILPILLFRSQRFKQKRLLSKLKLDLISSIITPKEASYALAKIISSAHNKKHLTTSLYDRRDWNNFLSQLSKYRYQIHDIDRQQIIDLIDDASNWLKVSTS